MDIRILLGQITVENVSQLNPETISSTWNNLLYILIGAFLTFSAQIVIEIYKNKKEKKTKRVLSVGNLTEYQTKLIETTVDLAQKYYLIGFYIEKIKEEKKIDKDSMSIDFYLRFNKANEEFNNLRSERNELIAKTEKELMLYRLFSKRKEKAINEIRNIKTFSISQTVENILTENNISPELININSNLSEIEKLTRSKFSPLVEIFINSLIIE
ncbi:MAG: hypothetical protein RBT49_19205 [Bacteroidales bacterium]|jgi:hypothetical protein|nr:hypothetical protein [Bacteroidales bacterium]